MTKFIIYIFLLSGILSCVSTSKRSKNSQKKYRKYIEEKYEISTSNGIRNYGEFAKKIGLKNGELVADVGAADGYIDVMMSMVTDSVSFYIQDISSENLNFYYSDSLYNHMNISRKTPQTNKFRTLLGTERSSLLPDTTFDKIFLLNSLHEFTYVKDMMDDLYKKLKYNGKIIIQESLSEANKMHIVNGCFTVSYTKDEIVKIMKHSKFNTNYQLYSDSTVGSVLIFNKN